MRGYSLMGWVEVSVEVGKDKSPNTQYYYRDTNKMLMKLRARPGVPERSRNFLSPPFPR
jgi:hypothetical protein